MTKEVEEEAAMEECVLQLCGLEQVGCRELERKQREGLDVIFSEMDAEVAGDEALDCRGCICGADEVQLCFAGELVSDSDGANRSVNVMLIESSDYVGIVGIIDGDDRKSDFGVSYTGLSDTDGAW